MHRSLEVAPLQHSSPAAAEAPTSAAGPHRVGKEAEPLLQFQGFQGLLGHPLLRGGRSPVARVCGREDSRRRRGLDPPPGTLSRRWQAARDIPVSPAPPGPHACWACLEATAGPQGTPGSPSSPPRLHPSHGTPISGRLPPPGPPATSPGPVPQSQQERPTVGTQVCPPDHFLSGSRWGSKMLALDGLPEPPVHIGKVGVQGECTPTVVGPRWECAASCSGQGGPQNSPLSPPDRLREMACLSGPWCPCGSY